MGVVMGIPSHNIDFKGTMYVLHFGFLFNRLMFLQTSKHCRLQSEKRFLPERKGFPFF
jgi:hypothetical protein